MFIKDVYLSKSKVKDDKRLSSKLNDYLSTLFVYKDLTQIDEDDYRTLYNIPDTYLSYVDSISTVSNTYTGDTGTKNT